VQSHIPSQQHQSPLDLIQVLAGSRELERGLTQALILQGPASIFGQAVPHRSLCSRHPLSARPNLIILFRPHHLCRRLRTNLSVPQKETNLSTVFAGRPSVSSGRRSVWLVRLIDYDLSSVDLEENLRSLSTAHLPKRLTYIRLAMLPLSTD
jgi:hypothetical protein